MTENGLEPFPWDIGVYDAHCHPTDTMASIASIPDMKAKALTVMSTRSQDQDLVFDTAAKIGACTSPDDQEESHKVIPCFGWHPWFSHQLYDDLSDDGLSTKDSSKPPPTRAEHYSSVLQPSCQDPEFLDSLPAPRPLSAFLSETEYRLQSYPFSLVGEVGLDRTFRLPVPWHPSNEHERVEGHTEGSREGRLLSPYKVSLSHQKAVLKAQLRLAGKLGRATSVHSVQGHTAVLEVLEELWKGHKKPSRRARKRSSSVRGAHDHEGNTTSSTPSSSAATATTTGATEESPSALPYPPRICLHSYSGHPDPLHQFLRPTNPAKVYFSFSHVINFSNLPLTQDQQPSSSSTAAETETEAKKPSPPKAEAVIRQLPPDRILVESDLHTAGEQADELLESVTRRICAIRGWELREGMGQLKRNWREFVFGVEEERAGEMGES